MHVYIYLYRNTINYVLDQLIFEKYIEVGLLFFKRKLFIRSIDTQVCKDLMNEMSVIEVEFKPSGGKSSSD